MKKPGEKRLTFAVCVSGYNWEWDYRIINGILRKCQKNDVNLLIFNSLMLKGDFPKGIEITKNLVRGESEIFNLINYDLVDGVILLGDSIYRRKSIQEISDKCDLHKIPCININDVRTKLKHNVYLENTHAMELVVDHLVKVHNCKRINFIGGYPDNKETIERLAAYKKILTENNIPIQEERIDYGHFWKHSVECVEKMLEFDVPEAIVCANDTMAVLISDYLKNRGFKIPQDIIITGFDGINDAFAYHPTITTVSSDFESTGARTYEMMEELIKGNKDIGDITIQSELIIQESCGCMHLQKEEHNFIDSRYNEKNFTLDFNKRLVKTNIYISDSNTSDEIYYHLLSGAESFGFKRFTFCLNADLENSSKFFFSNNDQNNYGIAKNLFEVYLDENSKVCRKDFEASQLLSYDFLNGPEPVVMTFSPLYYKTYFLGYMAFEPVKLKLEVDGDYFFLYSLQAANEIQSFYVKRELEIINKIDYMTGLYNRRGMDKVCKDILDELKYEKKHLYMLCADIDNLKIINDKYGHEAGDSAIIQIASAIKKVFADYACIRTGGDEFCIIISEDKKINVEKMIKKVDEELKIYNKNSQLPYSLLCSCGYYSLDSDKFISFEDMQNKADRNLYEVKAKHHQKKLFAPKI
ncbi:MAG: GGDEF domain-containing protein [Treponema sp.]|nr:GGDEF domain-containing protein [Treponema sp.]